MSRFGWAYVNDVITGSGGSTTPGGSDKAIQFASGSTFSGSTNFTFDYATNTVRLTGTLYADNLIVSSSTIFKSGSTKFGDDLTDTHQFTGSMYVTGVVSSSTGIQTAGAITSQGLVSSSLGFQTNATVQSAGNITSQSIISSSNGLQTNATVEAAGNIRSIAGDLSSSIGIQTGGFLTVAGSSTLKNGLTVTGSSFVQALSSSAQIQATSFAGNGLNITGVQATNVDGAGDDWAIQFKSGDTGTLTGSSNLLFSGSTLTLTGSFLMTGSSTFVNIGPTILSGTLNVTGAITGNNAFISGGLSVGNYVQMLPVGNVILPTNQTASYIYTSGSTNDLYFTQYQPGTSFTNTTRLRWLEGGLSSGLLHGGILSTVTGTTSFNLTSGSGLIVSYNASTGSDPYPTIQQVTWGNFVSQSLIYSSSAQITYISIDNFGQIDQTNVAFTPAQFKDRIIIGRVLHQSGAVTNGVITTPTTAYGINSNTQDFFRAFGPLKVSGQVLAASGTATLAITRTAGDSYVEGRNYSANPDSPNYVLAADDAALTTTKIFYSWVSGSTVNIDTNGGPGYTALIPNKYNLNGTVTTITPTNNKYTIQRVYWFPKSVTRSLYVYYGSTIYTSLAEAVAAIANEPNFTEGDNTKGSAVYLGAVVMEAGISNFTDTTKSQIVNGGLFRATSNGGGGGGGGTTSPGGSNHQIQFNDSGVFNGSANLTFDTTTLTLTGTLSQTNGNLLSNIPDDSYVLVENPNSGELFKVLSPTVGRSTITIGSLAAGKDLTVTIQGTNDDYFDITIPTSGTTAQFTSITGSTVTGSTALFTTITASNYVGIQAGLVVGAGGSGAIQYKNPSGGTITGSANLTFTGTDLTLTGSLTITGTLSGTTAQFTDITTSAIIVPSYAGVSTPAAYLSFFGTGDQGNVTLTTGTTTLAQESHYNNLTVVSGAILKVNGHRLYVKDTLTINAGGQIDDNGNNASGSTGGASVGIKNYLGASQVAGRNGIVNSAGTAGAGSGGNTPPNNSGLAPIGGAGGAGGANAGGVAGGAGGALFNQRLIANWIIGRVPRDNSQWASGGGGASGGSDSVNATSGAGGGAGGGIWIAARRIINSGSILAVGGNASNATGTSGNAGGGGGGGGGWIVIATTTPPGSIGTISTAGGTGGAGFGTGTSGSAGVSGAIAYIALGA